MKQYVNAKIHEKGHWLTDMLSTSNTFFEELDGSVNDIHFLPIAITLAYMHLALLKERLLHGKEMYAEDNTPVWKKELEDYIKKYQEFFVTKKTKWNKWRSDQIELHYHTKKDGPFSSTDAYCDIKDKVTGKKWQYYRENSHTFVLEPGVKMLKDRVYSEMNAAMTKAVYVQSFQLGQFLPGHEKDPPVADKSVGIVQLGPFSVASCDGDHIAKDFFTFHGHLTDDQPGEITQVYIRSGNSIDALQINYKDHKGSLVGNAEGGQPHTFNLGDKAVASFIQMKFASGLMYQVRFKFSDGTDTGNLGGSWSARYTVALDTEKVLDESFVVRSINMQDGSGPSYTNGVANVLLTYYHKSLF